MNEMGVARVCNNGNCGMFGRVIEQPDRKKCRVCGDKMPAYNKMNSDDGPSQLLLSEGEQPSKVDAPSERDGAMVFESKCDLDGCPIAPESIIVIPWSLFQKWVFLCKKLNVEWIAYLKGEQQGDKVMLAEDGMYFPRQLVQAAHVEVADGEIMQAGVIASVHSHVDMATFFSIEDKKHFNHPADLVVNRRGEIQGVTRRQLKCGNYQRVLSKINLSNCDDALDSLEALKAVMTREANTVTNIDKAFTERNYTVKGQHGVRTYSPEEARRYFAEQQDKMESEDENRYSEWQDQVSGPDRKRGRTFRRSDGGKWEDLRG